MFFKDDNLLNLAQQHHVRLLKENAELKARIVMLQQSSDIAKEAVDRFCPHDMLAGAYRWLESQIGKEL